MKIVFEKEDQNSKHLTFNDVEMNQFFVCADGHLCQKVSRNLYNTIADEHGELSGDRFSCSTDYVIRRIIPTVVKIEF
jgi:hypothetical protein